MNGQIVFGDDNELIDDLEYHVQNAIKRLQAFEPSEGYYLAFSGGKDSCVIKALADMSEVKYEKLLTRIYALMENDNKHRWVEELEKLRKDKT